MAGSFYQPADHSTKEKSSSWDNMTYWSNSNWCVYIFSLGLYTGLPEVGLSTLTNHDVKFFSHCLTK